MVLAADQGDASHIQDALAHLCRTYWYPLYAYVRHSGISPHDAQDLTQEFFRLLLEERGSNRPTATRAVCALSSSSRLNISSPRMASTVRPEARGQATASRWTPHFREPLRRRPCHLSAADEVFDRQWALALLELAMARPSKRVRRRRPGDDFAVLKVVLAVSHGAIHYRSGAVRLSVSEGDARVAVHQLAGVFRELYREEICQTLPDSDDLDAELRHLAARAGTALRIRSGFSRSNRRVITTAD